MTFVAFIPWVMKIDIWLGKGKKKYQDLYQAFRKLKSRYLTAPRRTVILKTFQDIYGTIDYDLRQTDTK